MFRETAQEAWRERFGGEAPAGAERVAGFLAHRSVRRFSDAASSEGRVDEATVAALVGAAQSAATSSNLHAYSMISVQEPETRARLAQIAGDQQQIETAAWFFVFVADLWRLAEVAGLAGEAPTGLDTAEMYTVATVDAVLAAERMVGAAESLGLGICYIGSLRNDPPAVAELLGLPERTFALFGLCLGVPAPESGAKERIKPRLGPEMVWHRERYNSDLDVSEYDARLAAFYAREGMNAGLGWIGRTGPRVTEKGLAGRETLLAFLQSRGILRR